MGVGGARNAGCKRGWAGSVWLTCRGRRGNELTLSTSIGALRLIRPAVDGLSFSFVGLELRTSVLAARFVGVDVRVGVATVCRQTPPEQRLSAPVRETTTFRFSEIECSSAPFVFLIASCRELRTGLGLLDPRTVDSAEDAMALLLVRMGRISSMLSVDVRAFLAAEGVDRDEEGPGGMAQTGSSVDRVEVGPRERRRTSETHHQN